MIQERDYQLDNLKGVLILLVVFAHTLERITAGGVSSNPIILSIWSVIYSFHMPVFIFVSGYFSKKFIDKDKWARSVVRSTLIPYFIANTAYWLLASRHVSTFMNSQFAMWYLLSLFFWRLMIHPLSKIRWLLVVSILFSLYFGFTKADKFLSIQRTISFFPYFAAGFLCSDTRLGKIKNVSKLLAGSLMLASFSVVVILALVIKMPTRVLTMAYPYSALEVGKGMGLAFRAIALVLGFSGILYTVSLTPAKKSFLTKLGNRTIVIYLLHPLFLRVYSKFNGPTIQNSLFVIVAAFLLTALICAILGNRYVERLYNWVMEKASAIILLNPD